MARLARFPNCISPSEYYELELFDDGRLDWNSKTTFLGYRAIRHYEKLNDRAWHAAANDKLLFETVMRGNGKAVPDILAFVHPGNRQYAGAASITDAPALRDFFATTSAYPLFIKPSHGYFGVGTYLATGFDTERDRLLLKDGSAVSPAELLASLEKHLDEGLLIQECLQPAPEIQRICGNRLSSVRLIIHLAATGPRIIGANWKIPAGDNIVDNTAGWSNGNLVAGVDHTSGRVIRLVQAQGSNGITDVQRHPDTGQIVLGTSVPLWAETTACALDASRLFPGIRLQGWDIVATRQGVMALEINLVTSSTVFATQLVTGRGLLDDMLRDDLHR
jgi:glutathione synthase/RimK-type ligase-like ATP-grasp enzyme